MSTQKVNNNFSASDKVTENKVLIAPLNWGLGHATRCIPIIHLLLQNNFTPVLASDGEALKLLQKEFPELDTVELPSYHIKYSKFPRLTKWKLLFSVLSIKRAVSKERNTINKLVAKENFVGLISDNRFGAFHKDIPSVYITHQLNVYSGWSTKITSKVHQSIISKHSVCWVPDSEGENSLSGKLSSVSKSFTPSIFIGNLSRLNIEKKAKNYDVLLLLSGPEPQRSILESKLLKEFSSYDGKVILVRGIVSESSSMESTSNIKVINYLTTNELEELLNSADVIIARSGYSTIMDLAKLNKKAFFIPTPGQSEQAYLAKNLEQKKIAPFCEQEQFSLKLLSKLDDYTGFVKSYDSKLNSDLLNLFKRH